ncbi:MAG: type IX secretion system membrane protein PorP/SprF [Bacteroidetes bacterium]|nr:MAG: type IX secretion system membrane protein PorP/SprF [Bacteroidota bacterium]
MYKNILKITICINLLLGGFAQAQDEVNHNLYTQNLFLLTPAAIGTQGDFYAYANYRNQWTGMPGAPVAFAAGLHGMIHKAGGLGLNIVSRQFGVYASNYISGAYAHNLKINDNMKLNFGVNFGGIFRNIDQSKISTSNPGDVAFVNNPYDDKPRFVVGFGTLFQYKKLVLGFSLPYMYNGIHDVKSTFSDFQGLVGYTHAFKNTKIELMPLFVLRKHNTASPIYDLNISARWNEMFSVRTGFRSFSSAYSYIFGFGIEYNNIGFQYAFELNQGELKTIAPLSHEFGLVFKIKSKQKESTDDKIAKLSARVDTLELVEKRNTEELKLVENQLKTLEDSKVSHEEYKKSEVFENTDTVTHVTTAEHPQEINYEQGYYIIHAVYNNKAAAEESIKIFKKAGLNCKVMYNASKKHYYTYFEFYTSKSDALKKMDEYKRKNYNDAWVFKYK